jgi:hypothetical protein
MWFAKKMYGARCPRDARPTSARRLRNACVMHRENVVRTSHGRRAALAHTFCIVRTHFVVRMPFSHARQMLTIKKKPYGYSLILYMRNFLRVFFFVNLVEWRKGEVCTFSHTIRLILYYWEYSFSSIYWLAS